MKKLYVMVLAIVAIMAMVGCTNKANQEIPEVEKVTEIKERQYIYMDGVFEEEADVYVTKYTDDHNVVWLKIVVENTDEELRNIIGNYYYKEELWKLIDKYLVEHDS